MKTRRLAIAGGVAALSLLFASCGDAPTTTPTSTPTAIRGVVLSAEMDASMRTRYERALASVGVQAVIVDAVVPGEGAVALGQAVPGADGLVTLDVDSAGRMVARRLARCLEDVGIVEGPVMVDAVLPSAQREIEERGYRAVAVEAMFDAAYSAREGDTVGVISSSASAGDAAIEVLDLNAQAVKVPVVTVGVNDNTSVHLDDGTICGAVRPAFRAEARAAVDLADQLARGVAPTTSQTQRLDLDGRSIPVVVVRPTLVTSSQAGD